MYIHVVIGFQLSAQLMWNGWLEVVCEIAIVVTATVGDLASVARQISIERDWIVVMCQGDTNALTSTRKQDISTCL